MLKFGNNQPIKVSKTFKGESFNANILANVNKTLIITRPYIEVESYKYKYLEHLNPKSLLYGNYEFEGTCYYFRTIVIKSSYTPFPHVILKEPEGKDIQTKILRKSPRYKTVMPIRIFFENKEANIEYEEVYSSDISLTGISIYSFSELPEYFIVEFFSGIKNIRLNCEIKKVKKDAYGGFNFFGCEITKISDEKYFSRFIENLKLIMEAK